MNIISTSLPEILIIEPDSFEDNRGFFMETYSHEKYQANGINPVFIQDNLSCSGHSVLRGLHYQIKHPQAKLIQIIIGEVFDVVVDIRPGSSTFGKWTSVILSGQNKRQLYVPEGFAHGFCVLSESAYFYYKCSSYYCPNDEGGIIWNDKTIDIKWPLNDPVVSKKDSRLPFFSDLGPELLPVTETPH